MRTFFYGNWFIGLCAVALGIEAALQQGVPLNGLWYHVGIFVACVAFYNHAYRGHLHGLGQDDRTRWYARNGRRQRTVQFILIGVACAGACIGWAVFRDRPLLMDAHRLALLLVFPLTGAAYYGVGGAALRNVGWLKPFVLGFVWAGVVTVYPVVVHAVLQGTALPDAGLTARLFVKNMMFVALLAVLFDIKDHAGDHRNELRTFVVRRGLRTTLFRIVLPLTVAGVLIFLAYGAANGFSTPKLLLNTVPFAAMMLVIYALRKRRSILYYLVVVDGLMLLKAVCGSVAMRWF
ncbi:MAG: hypothetical protein KF797_01260 [Flavobacteriales bacterium]|nr:hypothetical protein [Flavobacteriales bacterium]